jgi:putative addiction module component (TIGR02574 family)
MTEIADKIYEQALNLPVEDRVSLIDKLLESINFSLKKDVEEAWIEEVEKRYNDFKSGKTKLIPGEEVFEKIRKRFGNDI